ncbi:MAG: hypothetical protein R3B55_00805 [Candidatus Paceibacterota bacterium]
MKKFIALISSHPWIFCGLITILAWWYFATGFPMRQDMGLAEKIFGVAMLGLSVGGLAFYFWLFAWIFTTNREYYKNKKNDGKVS